jgi:hypothetical protein
MEEIFNEPLSGERGNIPLSTIASACRPDSR